MDLDAKTLPITGPCPVDFDRSTFENGATRRFCDVCQKNVHNLSAMSRKQARSFLRENAGKKMCVTYKHDQRGDIQFRDDCEPNTVPNMVPNMVPASALTRRGARPRKHSLPVLTTPSVPAVPGNAATPRSGTVLAFRRPAVAAGFAAALAACTPHSEAQLPPLEPEREMVEVEGKMEVEAPMEVEEPMPLLAGAVAIPEPIEPPAPVPEVEGEIEVPMPLGDIAVPELEQQQPPAEPDPDPLLGDTPCDGAKRPGAEAEPALPYQPTPKEHAVRGRIALPSDGVNTL